MPDTSVINESNTNEAKTESKEAQTVVVSDNNSESSAVASANPYCKEQIVKRIPILNKYISSYNESVEKNNREYKELEDKSTDEDVPFGEREKITEQLGELEKLAALPMITLDDILGATPTDLNWLPNTLGSYFKNTDISRYINDVFDQLKILAHLNTLNKYIIANNIFIEENDEQAANPKPITLEDVFNPEYQNLGRIHKKLAKSLAADERETEYVGLIKPAYEAINKFRATLVEEHAAKNKKALREKQLKDAREQNADFEYDFTTLCKKFIECDNETLKEYFTGEKGTITKKALRRLLKSGTICLDFLDELYEKHIKNGLEDYANIFAIFHDHHFLYYANPSDSPKDTLEKTIDDFFQKLTAADAARAVAATDNDFMQKTDLNLLQKFYLHDRLRKHLQNKLQKKSPENLQDIKWELLKEHLNERITAVKGGKALFAGYETLTEDHELFAEWQSMKEAQTFSDSEDDWERQLTFTIESFSDDQYLKVVDNTILPPILEKRKALDIDVRNLEEKQEGAITLRTKAIARVGSTLAQVTRTSIEVSTELDTALREIKTEGGDAKQEQAITLAKKELGNMDKALEEIKAENGASENAKTLRLTKLSFAKMKQALKTIKTEEEIANKFPAIATTKQNIFDLERSLNDVKNETKDLTLAKQKLEVMDKALGEIKQGIKQAVKNRCIATCPPESGSWYEPDYVHLDPKDERHLHSKLNTVVKSYSDEDAAKKNKSVLGAFFRGMVGVLAYVAATLCFGVVVRDSVRHAINQTFFRTKTQGALHKGSEPALEAAQEIYSKNRLGA